MSKFFLERPVFAWVIAIAMMLGGALAIHNLPISQYHSGIDYVTPVQAHQGLRDSIVRCRSEQQQAQRQRRRAENQKVSPQQQQNNWPPALVPVV